MNRRLVLLRIVQVFSATGLTAFAYPFFRNWFPVATEELTKNVHVGEMSPGDVKYVEWLGRRVVVLRRTPEQMAVLEPATSNLKDPESTQSIQPESARNAARSLRPELFVAFASCTHLGCEVSIRHGDPDIAFTCPCHQSEFDSAGRVGKQSAAPTNLEVPRYQFISGNELRLWRPT